jgi:hypothetical protein
MNKSMEPGKSTYLTMAPPCAVSSQAITRKEELTQLGFTGSVREKYSESCIDAIGRTANDYRASTMSGI